MTPVVSDAAAIRCLLVSAGEHLCAVPLNQVRRVIAALASRPLPSAAPELLGLAEFGGEPLPVLDLRRLVDAPAGATPAHPVTVVAWAGPPTSRELVGLAADAAISIADVPAAAVAGASRGLVAGEALVGERPVRVLNLEQLGLD
ncbi:MAG TPA: chemotaxis protein CheW [Thermoanaerobaculaceae bacterium]|nr:chemotaxis protein CheW [Thermoanaerobaculaceae bacterium]